uniref:Apolipoprotein A-I n=1 Tax=Macrostomum lignano TaxID=282301 RepID=A0A1I8GPK8_9PLAT
MKLLWVLIAVAAVAAPIAFTDAKALPAQELDVSDWREKAIEMLERAIARLEDAIAKLPEDSRLRAYLNKALEYLRRKLTDLQDAAFNFGESDRVDFLERILERLEQALERLPEGPLRDRLQQNIDRIRDLLNN